MAVDGFAHPARRRRLSVGFVLLAIFVAYEAGDIHHFAQAEDLGAGHERFGLFGIDHCARIFKG